MTLLLHHAGGQLGPPAQAAPATAAQVEELAGHVEELAGQVAKLKNMVMDLAGDMKVMSAQITNIRARTKRGQAAGGCGATCLPVRGRLRGCGVLTSGSAAGVAPSVTALAQASPVELTCTFGGAPLPV